MDGMFQAFKKHKQSDIYVKFKRNKNLFDGKSVEVFYKDVLKRVKLEYMGALTENNEYTEFVRSGNFLTRVYQPFKDLVVGNNVLGAVTKLYAELATGTEPTITIEESKKEILEEIDLQDLVGEAMAVQSYGGKFLLKGFLLNNKLYLQVIPPHQYFAVPSILNSDIVDYYVVFEEEKKELTAEIYKQGRTEYRKYKVQKDCLAEVPYPADLKEYGAMQDGLGWAKIYKEWQVVEVNNLFKRSDYLEDLVILNRELVVGDTLTSQAFDKVANPLLQIPEGAVEYGEHGELRLHLEDRTIIVEPEDKDIKQVEMSTKTEEWKSHRANILEQIYQNTGTNEQAFGLNKTGTASGEAKRRDMERTIATVVAKRDRILTGLEKVIKWGYQELHGTELDIVISGKDILALGVAEKILIAVQGISSGILSVETAIRYINISDVDVKEELHRIKSELSYREKLIQSLQILQQIDMEERVAGLIKTQADELVKELGLDEEEPVST
ncbi:hypothetical protein A2U09_10050 [Fusobacterium necrophorum subsp. funduliforme]|uniref:hypothetical protein n=1 Tax=Fusobacterium necrophorum TaxID=859 RepID=UPI0007874A51|nr:hypothetical protein [Fusobacterium necrophorum]KYM62396.1 hypothetical protein A2U09_10050 [Fusobacterium necrophorum subsp. funduliforme]